MHENTNVVFVLVEASPASSSRLQRLEIELMVLRPDSFGSISESRLIW